MNSSRTIGEQPSCTWWNPYSRSVHSTSQRVRSRATKAGNLKRRVLSQKESLKKLGCCHMAEILRPKSTAKISLVSDCSLIQRDIAKEWRAEDLLGIPAGMEASQAAEDTGCYTSFISAKATLSAKLSQREKLHCKKPRHWESSR